MPEDEKLSETIRELYAIVNQLERDYNKHDRRFTLDGHLLGSIGEVYAAERYGIELAKSSSERHDGTTTDERKRDVQIKVTQRSSIGLSSEPAYLLVLKIDENGSFKEVFNGPGNIVWEGGADVFSYLPTPPSPRCGGTRPGSATRASA